MTRDPSWPPRFGTDHATPVAYEQAALEAVRETLRDPPLRDSVVVQDVILVGTTRGHRSSFACSATDDRRR